VGDGPLKSELEMHAREVGVSERVHFEVGVADADLLAYYLACDVFVLPSIARSEAFAIVQLEAMACRRPVVNTQLDSGVPFVSRHEESGLTVPPEDPKALAAAIRKLLADDAWRLELGARGRQRVEAEFTKEKMAASVLAVYQNALGKMVG
ncbi:MAG: glycosyltransferase, partial [Polyangiaceae bacterium]